jgi:hypothetical protein
MASGWKRRFDDLIPLPRGRQLVTLEDATKLFAGTRHRLSFSPAPAHHVLS